MPLSQKEMHKKEFENRNELEEDEAKDLLTRLHARL